MVDIFYCLISWLSPVLVFTTEEAGQCWKNEISNEAIDSCHLKPMKKLDELWNDKIVKEKWDKIKILKRSVTAALEKQRAQKIIKSSLEASPSICIENKEFLDCIKGLNLEEILITSTVKVVNEKNDDYEEFESNGIFVKIDLDKGKKCERCWKLYNQIQEDINICLRCSNVIKNIQSN